MGRRLTLRGLYELDDNELGNPQLLFDYVSPDRTRAWKVIRAAFWPKTWKAEIGTADGQMLVCACLSTDDMTITKTQHMQDVSDNRQIAWAQHLYNIRASPVADYIGLNGAMIGALDDFVVDPDHVVVNELWLTLASLSDSSTSPTREYNYLITLEEITITPSESVLQQIKGIGQNIDL